MKSVRVIPALLPCILSAGLAGCGDSGVQEVKQWMDDVRRQTPTVVSKISEPKKFTPFTYNNKNEVDPYNPAKLSVALARQQADSRNSLKPDLERRKEPLEAFPLDTVRMVGTLQRPGLNHALLQVEKTVFQAKVGHYVGQNFGIITRITDTEVHIRELVRDPAGEWSERQAKLELQENKQ